MSGLDQTKIYTLQMFHAMVNNSNDDYARLIWKDLVYQVNRSSYKAVQYSRYVKLIINHVFETYPNVPKRMNEPYHYINDDDPILMMFTIRDLLNATAIRIPDEFLTKEIIKTGAYKDYDVDYNGVDVPPTQSLPVVSTQGTHRALSTPRIPKPNRTSQKKKEKVLGSQIEYEQLIEAQQGVEDDINSILSRFSATINNVEGKKSDVTDKSNFSGRQENIKARSTSIPYHFANGVHNVGITDGLQTKVMDGLFSYTGDTFKSTCFVTESTRLRSNTTSNVLNNSIGGVNEAAYVGRNSTPKFTPTNDGFTTDYPTGSSTDQVEGIVVEKTSTTNIPSGPYEVNVGVIFSVKVTSLKDIDGLTKSIEAGKYEDEKLLAEVMATSNMLSATVSNNSMGLTSPQGNVPKINHIFDMTGPSIESPSVDSPIIRSVLIQSNPNSYARATGASTFEPSKGKENFCPLYSKNLCNGVDFTIPKKVVEAIHDVPLQVLSKDGISLIASQLGKPIMLDSYTTSMCIDSWGRSGVAWCLIDINADDVLKDSLTMGIPFFNGSRFSKETNIKVTHIVENSSNGLQTLVNKRKNGKSGSNVNSTKRSGKFRGKSIKPNVKYKPKAPVSVSRMGTSNVVNTSRLGSINAPTTSKNQPSKAMLDEESEEEVENMYDGIVNLLSSAKSGATTFPVVGDAT
ncbi:hypothetical protein Tco_0832080 [Tanacetum coccineum]